MNGSAIAKLIEAIPAGAWGVGVSGGADSVALLRMLSSRKDLSLRVVHLDHQTRAGESAADATFVEQLAAELNLPIDVARLDQIALPKKISNRSARFRAARLAWFRNVVQQNRLQGMILAHHADDQAETIFLRLLRGSGYAGLAGMSSRSVVGGLVIQRPLLQASRESLRAYLETLGQRWREDASNVSSQYARNRVRVILSASLNLREAMLTLGEGCRALRTWVSAVAPRLEERFRVDQLADLPTILARHAAKRWLMDAGVDSADIVPEALDRLIEMSADAASPAKQYFPGQVIVRRRRGLIEATPLG